MDAVRPPFPTALGLTPGLFLEFVNSGVEEMNMEPGAPDSFDQIGTQFAFVKCASCELVGIPSTNLSSEQEISGFCYDSCPAFVPHNEKQWEVSQGWN